MLFCGYLYYGGGKTNSFDKAIIALYKIASGQLLILHYNGAKGLIQYPDYRLPLKRRLHVHELVL